MDEKKPEQNQAQPATTVPAPAPNQPKKSKKGLIIGLSIGAAVFLIVLIVLVVLALTVWAGPSKDDYMQAKNQATTAKDNYDSIGKKLGTLLLSARYSSDLNSQKATLSDSVNKYKQNLATLDESKALKDDDVKKSYDALKQKSDEMLSYVESLQGSIDSIGKFLQDCSNANPDYASAKKPDDILSAYEKSIQPCTDATNQLKKSKNQEYAKLAGQFSTVLQKNHSLLSQAVDAANDKDRSKLSDLQTQLSDSESDAQKILLDFQTSFSNKIKEIQVTENLNNLANTLDQKANEK